MLTLTFFYNIVLSYQCFANDKIVDGNSSDGQCFAKGNECANAETKGLYLPQVIDNVLVYTVATEETDGFVRYMHTANEFNIQPIVLGYGKKWQGGEDIKNQAGGGWKINLLKEELEKHKEDTDKIILFTDGYDVIFLNDLNAIVEAFKKMDARILFSAEAFCWPDKSLADRYPTTTIGKNYLNSGLYIGYLPEIIELLNYKSIKDTDDDQLYFSLAYLDEKLRNKLKFKLDHNSKIFQNLNGAKNEVEMYKADKESKEVKLRNVLTGTDPLILHGNGPSKITLNALSNYLAKSWNEDDDCKHCKMNQIDYEETKPEKLPIVFMSLFIEQATPFFDEFLQKIHALNYPKERIHLFVHNNVKYHSDVVDKFVKTETKDYVTVKQIRPEDEISEWKARDLSLDQCLLRKCDLYFTVDSLSHLDNPHTLRLLAEQNRTFVSPMLVRSGKAWSNFWGALTTEGFYARSSDYMDIVHNDKRGLWNVPFVSNCYLINATLFKKYDRSKITHVRNNLDADMSLCANLRDLDIFMYVSNRLDFGHLINPDTYDVTLSDPDMYQIFENNKDWEDRYIHEEFPDNLLTDKKPLQPCPDVYWFPIVTERFCDSLVHAVETFGKWSDGSNYDVRLEGGYEAVPTRDIHMNQIGFERHWLYFLQRYIRPIQEFVFTGYFHDPPRSLMNFVVRYRLDEQPSLRPHHDSSTYTINIALNSIDVDYEGGGCRFIRYNCSVVDTRKGWMMMHPGRLTHYHEGLKVKNGTRYIMVAFVDP